jgi:hypothetical protein
MPTGKVIHHQRLIGRIFRAASAANFAIDEIEFTNDGTIIVKPRPPGVAPAKPGPDDAANKNPWDEVLDAQDEKRSA